MLISEIYQSRQGEGLLTGTPSVFVRTSGCNLRCSFCDTPFASWRPEGNQMSPAEIIAEIQAVAEGAGHVVITGGEPMLPRELNRLCQLIRELGLHITIETAGTLFRELDCDLMSISPKLSNSDPSAERAGEWRLKHQSTRHRPDVVEQLMQRYTYQLKFVVDAPDDLCEILNFLESVKTFERPRVLLMPQGVDPIELAERKQWLEPLAEEHGFSFCPRRHIEWYGNQRGT